MTEYTDRQPGSQVGDSRDSVITQRVPLVCQTNKTQCFVDLVSLSMQMIINKPLGCTLMSSHEYLMQVQNHIQVHQWIKDI